MGEEGESLLWELFHRPYLPVLVFFVIETFIERLKLRKRR